ncbi:MAG: hypothetical protein GSR79_05355 [Desulfurococcales archaeon]|nr:hypothetical protein [Desulfurococcales archaeon]
MNKHTIIALTMLFIVSLTLATQAYSSPQNKTVTVKYIEKITYSCLGGTRMCPKVYGLQVNHTVTVYVEYYVNMTTPSPTSTVLAKLVINGTYTYNPVYLRLVGRGMIENEGYASTYYTDITPEDFGYTNSTYLAVDPPIAIDFRPEPSEIVDGFYIARIGEPYTHPNLSSTSLKYFELYYDPDTGLFVGGKLHFIYTEIVKMNGYPIIWGFYDVYAEIYPPYTQPPWITIGKQTAQHNTTNPSRNTSVPSNTHTPECLGNWMTMAAIGVIEALVFIAVILICCRLRGS